METEVPFKCGSLAHLSKDVAILSRVNRFVLQRNVHGISFLRTETA